MADSGSIGAPDPTATTSDERSMAVLSHALQVIGGWIPALIIFFIRRQSRFVSFQSLQVFFLELAYLVVTMVTMTFWIGVLMTLVHARGNGGSLPAGLFVLFPVGWLAWMFVWVTKIVVAVIYSIKAGRGEWAEIPVVGGWARSILKIGPGGSPVG